MKEMISVIQPKEPQNKKNWIKSASKIPELVEIDYPHVIWRHKTEGFLVISAVEVANQEEKINIGPEYHISISRSGKRCSAADALFILNDFGLIDAEEDNHVPYGFVRNFWRPVNDNLSGHECACKKTEPAIKEDKGEYIWRGITK